MTTCIAYTAMAAGGLAAFGLAVYLFALHRMMSGPRMRR